MEIVIVLKRERIRQLHISIIAFLVKESAEMKRKLIPAVTTVFALFFFVAPSFLNATIAFANEEDPVNTQGGWIVKEVWETHEDCICAKARFKHATKGKIDGCCMEADCAKKIPYEGQEYELVKTDEEMHPIESGYQKFKVIKIYKPPPVLESFSAKTFCTPPGQHSDMLCVEVKALDNKGNPFSGAGVTVTVEDGPQQSGKTDGNGFFSYTFAGRAFIGKSVKVEVGNLDPKTFVITEEAFVPCTAICEWLKGSYDPETDSVPLMVKGLPPSWDAIIWDTTLGGNSTVCSGALDDAGEMSCVYPLPVGKWGTYEFKAQVGGQSGPICKTEVETPYPKTLVVYGDCTPHGQDSDILVLKGEMRWKDDVLFVKPLTLTMFLPDPDKTSMTIELVNGEFGPIEIPGAKAWMDKYVVFNWPNLGNETFQITKKIFKPCRTPPPTPTPIPPTPTSPPGFGFDESTVADIQPRYTSAASDARDGGFPLIGIVAVVLALVVLVIPVVAVLFHCATKQ